MTTTVPSINNNDNNNTNNALEPRAVTRDLFSATIGSILCCYVGQPFDTIKVKQQTNPDYYTTFIRTTTTKIWQQEGLTAFWKGAVPTAAGMVLENCMAFGVNEALKRALFSNNNTTTTHQNDHDDDDDDDDLVDSTRTNLPLLWKPFAMGALTGCCSALVLLPSEIIKAKTQITTDRHVTSQDIIRKMLQSSQPYGGLRSMLIGLDGQLCRDATFYAMFFGGYELSCFVLRNIFPNIPDELNYFLSGGIAGMGGWFVAMPVSVEEEEEKKSLFF
jgi:solute carrier family 25 (mitochondrial ornithine transporter) member 2/15